MGTAALQVRYSAIQSDDEGSPMAELVLSGREVSAGTYRCTKCVYEMRIVSSGNLLPPCPSCRNGQWHRLKGNEPGKCHDGDANALHEDGCPRVNLRGQRSYSSVGQYSTGGNLPHRDAALPAS